MCFFVGVVEINMQNWYNYTNNCILLSKEDIVKKSCKIIVLALIFCLMLTTAVFADGEEQAVTANDHEKVFRCGKLPTVPPEKRL